MKTGTDNNNEYCTIKVSDKKSQIVHCYLENSIHDPHEYIELFEKLNNVEENDEVFIHINSWGGQVDTTLQIINNIEQCNAHVTTVLEGAALSAGSMIFLAGHSKEINKYSYMMCHYYYGGIHGKGQEILAESNFSDKHFKEVFKRIYKGFLTSKELESLFNGTDFWFNSKEIKKRLIGMKNGKES